MSPLRMGRALLALAALAALVACGRAVEPAAPSPPGPPVPTPTPSPPAPPAPPSIETVEPRVAITGVPVAIEISGRRFGAGAGPQDAPALTLERTRDIDGNPVSDSSATGLLPFSSVDNLDTIGFALTFDAAALPGVYGFRLTRSDGTTADFPDALLLLPAPVVTGLETVAYCASVTPMALAVVGHDLPVLAGVAATFQVDQPPPPFQFTPGFSATAAAVPSGCRQVPFDRADVALCTRLEADLSPPFPAPGLAHVTVVEPPPADPLASKFTFLVDGGLVSFTTPGLLSAVAAPLELLVGVGPATGPFPIPLQTVPIHVVSGQPPTAVLEGLPLPVTLDGCLPSGIPGHDLCASFTATVPQGFAPGSHTITVSTMPGCAGQVGFTLVARPTVTGVTPQTVCINGGSFQVTGTDFINPTITLGGHDLPTSTPCAFLTNVCTQASASLFGFPGPPGTYPLSITSQSQPPATSLEAASLTLAPGPPLALIPEPQTVFAFTAHPIFLPINPPFTTITQVALGFGTSPTPVEFTQDTGGVHFTAPAGQPGGFDIQVTEGGLCTRSALQPVFQVADYRLLFEDYTSGLGVNAATVQSQPGGFFGPLPTWQPTGGNPGGAASFAFDAAFPTWWFEYRVSLPFGPDLFALLFDLRLASSAGAPVAEPDVRVLTNGFDIQSELHYTLPVAPGPLWQSFVVPLDDPTGWTISEAAGTRPATAAELRRGVDFAFAFWIRGRHFDGAGETWIDNVAVELHH